MPNTNQAILTNGKSIYGGFIGNSWTINEVFSGFELNWKMVFNKYDLDFVFLYTPDIGAVSYSFYGRDSSGDLGQRSKAPVVTPDGKYFIIDYDLCFLTSDVAYLGNINNFVIGTERGTGTSAAINSAGTSYIKVEYGKNFYVGPLCGLHYYTSAFPINTPNVIKNIGTNFSGLKVGVTTSENGIWISNNMAKTWSQSSASTAINWNEIVMSDDGNFMVASSTGNKIYTSLDGGLTWQVTTSSPDANWSSLSMSSNGQVIVAIAQNTITLTNSIYMSKDYGNSWQQVNPGGSMPLNGWKTVFITASGNKIRALNQNGKLWELKSSGIQGGSFDSITLQYNGDNTWSITNMTGNNLRNY